MPQVAYNITPNEPSFIKETEVIYPVSRRVKTQDFMAVSSSAATSVDINAFLFAEIMEKKNLFVAQFPFRISNLWELEQPLKQEEVLNLYEIKVTEQDVIREFVKDHSYLLPILKTAKDKIISVFGEKVRIFLELHHDPEEDFEELFIVIKSLFSAKEARRLMNKLDNEWFLQILDKTQGKLSITEDHYEF